MRGLVIQNMITGLLMEMWILSYAIKSLYSGGSNSVCVVRIWMVECVRILNGVWISNG